MAKKKPSVIFTPNSPNKKASEYTFGRYLMVGAAIGGYLGYIFRVSERDLNLVAPIAWGVMIGIAIFIFTVIMSKGRPPFKALVKQTVVSMVFITIGLVGLEFRNTIHGMGGRMAVIIYCVALGLLIGAMMYARSKLVTSTSK